ncbi:5-(carboxyamino)imidazole ribonucleotide mutase [Candidatus Poribacteria bacterium]|nr:5-(carboxyamino)imidazole ribonucleotide mutase [Candidatus Poribacteria bacterium]MYB66162.1 5-(carboxyamino)imidazole ribonucleotide mutase [Candidatus Poribacteria bacterium]MYF56160.1 5-(carboxyamino)imidazole ribonucleotide mutase [Candidatus Poribacteria bacterium]MYI92892.1 5-(carboxyamino)imidazole ribonucleotide mutase [Candidatus Poribacteria bacterium]
MSLKEQKTPLVGIVMGSDSDLEKMSEAAKVLEDFEVPFEITISSAHRSPERTLTWTENFKADGGKVIIAGAGRAAHLAGVVAAHTTLPVIGVPIDGGPLNGVDALYATVQMPPGIPVGTMAIGSGGARNAGIFAVQILALEFPELEEKLQAYKKKMSDGVAEKAARLEEVGYENY